MRFVWERAVGLRREKRRVWVPGVVGLVVLKRVEARDARGLGRRRDGKGRTSISTMSQRFSKGNEGGGRVLGEV
jgi:hypothetical protein